MAAVRQFLSMTETFKSRAMIDIDLTSAPPTEIERLLKSQEELREICDRNLRALREARAQEVKRRPQNTRRAQPRLLAG